MLKHLHSKIGAILLVLMMLAAPGAALAAGTGTSTPDHVTLSWTSNPATTMTVTWRTNTQTSASVVQYAPQSGSSLTMPSTAAKVNGTVSSYSSSIGKMDVHHATLTNLTPGTSYIYRVGDGTHWSGMYKFKTEPLNDIDLKAVIFSDSQSGSSSSYNYSPWKTDLTSAVNREHPDFAVITGDLVEVGRNQNQWEAWYSAVKGTLENLPLMPVVGNHDTYVTINHGAKPTAFTAQFTLPSNGPAGLKEQAYSYDYGPVHFVVLDSQGQEEGSKILTTQKQWLDQDLKATKQTWKVVFFHKSPYPVKNNRSNSDVKAAFSSILEQNHVDLVVSGHDHTAAHTYAIYNGKKATTGTIYALAGRSGAKVYTDVTRRSYDTGFFVPKDQPVYSLLQVSGKKLQFITKKANGTVVDSFTINKS
ncbi:MAG TPA: metallophosphoesterase family protein [Syntrophomonadaceae bacterium]|nr:metallophosphoesterase family protein [Syntrophomonadaceae bacterium]